MSRSFRYLVMVAALAAVAGCSQAPTGPGSSNLVDGTYQGRANLVSATGPGCPDSQYGNIEIADRVLDFGYVPGVTLEAAVRPDGSLHSAQGSTVLDGRLDSGRLAFTITSPVCQSSYDARFIWNHS